MYQGFMPIFLYFSSYILYRVIFIHLFCYLWRFNLFTHLKLKISKYGTQIFTFLIFLILAKQFQTPLYLQRYISVKISSISLQICMIPSICSIKTQQMYIVSVHKIYIVYTIAGLTFVSHQQRNPRYPLAGRSRSRQLGGQSEQLCNAISQEMAALAAIFVPMSSAVA